MPVGIQLFQSCQIVLAGLVAMAALGASARAETRFGDWELVCPPNGSQQAEIKPGNAGIDVVGGKSTCRLQQAQAANAGRDIVFLFNIVRQDKRNVAVVSVPLGVYLPAGLELRVDGGKARRAVFEACNLTGCHAGFALNAGLEWALKRGRMLTVTLRDTKASAVPITVSLDGITAGLKALSDKEGRRDG